MSYCAKPGCPLPATVALAYDYAGRRAILEDPADGDPSPHLYALCTSCAERLTPPRGWVLEDLRRRPRLFRDDHVVSVRMSGGAR